MLISALRMGRGKQGILQECRPPIQKMILETFLDFFLKGGGTRVAKNLNVAKKRKVHIIDWTLFRPCDCIACGKLGLSFLFFSFLGGEKTPYELPNIRNNY